MPNSHVSIFDLTKDAKPITMRLFVVRLALILYLDSVGYIPIYASKSLDTNSDIKCVVLKLTLAVQRKFTRQTDVTM